MDGVVALDPAERIGQGAAGMRQQQADPRETGQMAGEQQPRHRDRRVGEAADGVDQIVIGEPLVAADVMGMEEDRRLPRRGDLPERVERGVVEIAADPLGLGRDHRALEAGVERFFEYPGGQRPVLQRHRGERGQRGQPGRV